MAKELVGKVTHYFDKAGVAVVELTGTLKVGDKVSIERDGEGFEQGVKSMQVEKKPIKQAKSGDAIGLKVNQPVKENSTVSKVVE